MICPDPIASSIGQPVAGWLLYVLLQIKRIEITWASGTKPGIKVCVELSG
jgi:hypothetical protein